ncbi:MAG: hypothetical protein VKP62_16645 [Candidatus Sericytochromatia bacterium]|nr:hypothetical protein [Candidatus Sericytochromatia bacterium]
MKLLGRWLGCHHAVHLGCAAAWLLTGCGQHDASPTSPPRQSQLPIVPTAPGMPGAPGAMPGLPAPTTGMPGMSGPMPSQALSQLAQAWNSVSTLSARYDLRETKGSEVETAKVTFHFKKPGRYRYEVAQHSTSIKNGSNSVFDTKTRQITSRLGGVASLLPIKGGLDDTRSRSLRGWTLDQTDYATQIEMFLQPGAAVSAAGSPSTGFMLELQRPARYAGTVEAMRLTLDPQRGLPTMIEMVAGGQLVYRKKVSDIQINPTLSADKFSM